MKLYPETQAHVEAGQQTRLWADVLLGGPLLLWAATRERPLEEWERAGVALFGIGTLIYNLYYYQRYLGERPLTFGLGRRPGP